MRKKMFFTTLILLFLVSLSALNVEIGTQDGTTNYMPANGFYDFGWSRVLYKSEDINLAIDINAISYLVTNTPANYLMPNQQIYLKHTSAESLDSNAYLDPTTDDTYQLVFDGEINYNGSGWVEIPLDSEFSYNGTDNLEVFFINNDGDYASSYPVFAKCTVEENDFRSLYKYADNEFPALEGTLVNYFPCTRLHFTSEGAPTFATLTEPSNGAMNVDLPVSLEWTSGENTESYDVYLSDSQDLVTSSDASALIAENISETTYSVTELENITSYYWKVVSKNSTSEYTATSQIFSFTTPAEEGSLVIGNGVLANQGLPMEPYFGYTISQTIYLQEWINTENQRIEEISYYYNGNSEWTEENVQIWMAHTDLDAFADNTSWVAQDQLLLVYDGPLSVPASEGWVTIALEVPFNYNNTQNLLVAFESNTVGFSTSSDEFFCTQTEGNQSLEKHSDSVNYDFIAPEAGTLRTSFPNTMINFGDIPTEPQLMVNPSEYAWNPTIMGTSAIPAIFSLRNSGLGTLTINSLAISGDSEFSLTDDNEYPLALTTNVAQFTVNFMPVTVGDFTANIIITDSEGSETILPLTASGYDAMISEFPYFEGFEDVETNEIPTDWNTIINSTATAYANVYTLNPYEGEKSLRMYNSGDVAPADLKLITPPLADMNTKRVKFYARASAADVVLGVGSSSSNYDASAYNEIITMPLTVEYQIFYVNFNEIPEGDNMLCFDYIGNNTTYKTIYIDNVTIENIPSGADADITPTELAFGNIYLNRTGVETFNVANMGAEDLIVDLSSEDGIFTFENPQVTVTTGNNTDIIVTFNPAVEGEYTGSFLVETNADNMPSLTINATAFVLPALPEGVAVIGDGVLTNQGLPFEPYYRHSYSQSIYLANEIGITGQRIEDISWHFNGNSAWGPDEMRIFLGHTNETSFATSSDWIDIAELTEVFTGTITVPAEDGWVETQLDMPFVYDNTQNLVVAVFHSNPDYHASNDEFYCTATTETRSILYYSDSVIPDPTAPLTANYMRNSYPNVKLQFGEVPEGADMIVSPVSTIFDMTAVDALSSEKTITMRSVGLSDVTVANAPVITGEDADQFSITTDNNTYPVVLPFMDTATIGVSFNPNSEGTKTANLEVIDNVTRQTHIIALSAYAYADDGNDQAEDATSLTLPVNGDTYAIMPVGDIDWYKIPAMGIGDTLLVQTTTATGSNINVRAWLYGPVTNPTEIIGSESIANGSNIEHVLPISGDYYLRVAETSVYPAGVTANTRKNLNGENDRLTRDDTGLYNLFVDANYNYDYNAPFNLVATNSTGFVELTWEEPEYERYLVSYSVYRDGEQINPEAIEIGTNSYNDADVVVGQEYSYYVVGVYEEPNGQSLPSNTVSITYFNDGEALWGDDFESHPDFALNLGNWIQHDVDGGSTYGISNVEFENAGEAMSYIVFNPSATTPPITDMNPYEGDKFLASFASSEGVNDDWIITPAITVGTTTVVSFYAKSHTDEYGLERFRVKMSLGGSEVSDFQYSLHQGVDYLEAPTEWTPYYFNVSQLVGNTVRFAIQCVSANAFVFLVDNFRVDSTEDGVDNDDSQASPVLNGLAQNYPNPFNPETSITYSMQKAGNVTLDIFNLKGQKVKSLVNGYQEKGNHTIAWNGTDESGKSVSSGVYFYKMKSGQYTSSRKMILMK